MEGSVALKAAPAPTEAVEIDPCTAVEWLASGDTVLVDVRETVEYEAEHIPGALLCPLSTFEAELFPQFPNKRVIIHCAVGKRSAAACKQLLNAGYTGELRNLAGGIGAWKESGCATEVQPRARKDIPFLAGSEQAANVPPMAAGVHPGRVLRSEFLVPFGMSASDLARAIRVPTSRVSAILRGERAVSAETALRLARYLCTTDEFWLRLQTAHDLAVAREKFGEAVEQGISPRRTGKVVRAPTTRDCG